MRKKECMNQVKNAERNVRAHKFVHIVKHDLKALRKLVNYYEQMTATYP